ncbi:MAG: PEGA domain-containing protein [Candidatus Eisenbacteria bacterium]
MTPVSLAPKWAVSGRTRGEVLTAGVSTTGLEVLLLGVPEGFTPLEVEGWLRDLSGVASETSRGDQRERAIPALLHHALTGLLFSQAELWGRASAAPCSAAFVESHDGCAFGWVGVADVHVVVDGVPTEPRWVLVRDESGNEARAAVFANGHDVVVSLDWWPNGNDGSEAPACIEAVYASESVAEQAYAPALAAEVEAARAAEAAAEPEHAPEPEPIAHAVAAAPLPEHLDRADQPGLATPADTEAYEATEAALAALAPFELEAPEAPEATQPTEAPTPIAPEATASPAEPAPVTSVAPELQGVADVPVHASEANANVQADEPAAPEASLTEAPAPATEDAAEHTRGAHPVGRWLSRMLGFGRNAAPATRPSQPEPDSEATPLSTYDSLLSDAVAPAEPAAEQTHLELPAEPVLELAAAPSSEFLAAPEYDETFALPDPALAAVIAHPHETPGIQPLAAEPEVTPVESIAPTEAVAPIERAAPVESAAPIEPVATAPGLAPAGLADVLGAAFAPAPATPVEPEPVVEPSAFTHADLLRALAESPLASRAASAPNAAPLEIVREPVGAAADFAIAPLPGTTPVARVPEPPAAAPAAVRPLEQPPVLRPLDAPPVLHVHVQPASAPPVLRVGEAAEPAVAPPVLRVEPLPVPPPVIVPTPPVAPVVLDAGFAPSAAAAPSPAGASAEEAPAAPPRIQWPQFEDRVLEPRRWYRRRPALVALVVVLFGAGWMLGTLANPRSDEPGPLQRALRAVGLGGALFELNVDSSPPGAWIAVDGKDLAKRTPARVELKPGAHEVTLTLPELGSAKFPVKGARGAQVALAPTLHGALTVTPADPNVPITVSLDGRTQGYAPIALESLAPGLHELQFSGPGMAPWAQNINVRIGQTVQVVARPMTAPGTGVLQVQATLNDADGVSPLSGAQVWVDGALRGVTPLELELPRGPHSVKVVHRSEVAAIQVIDLPGGNQRIASFDFGLDLVAPQVNIVGASRVMPANGTGMISAAFSGLAPRDLREAWLHVRSAEGLWRRYPMTPVKSPGATVMAAVFPAGVFDASGRTIWYVSATAVQGDEYFSEMQPALLEGAKPAARPAAPRSAAGTEAAN